MDTQSGHVFSPHDDESNAGASQQSAATPQTSPDTLPPVPGTAAGNPAPEESTVMNADQQQTEAGGFDDASGEHAVGWQYNQEPELATSSPAPLEDLTWNASEFIEHPKGFGWYALLGLVGLALAALNYLVTRDVVSTGAILVAAVLFGIYAGHKPRTQEYHLSSKGLQIGGKLYLFQAFKAFSVMEEGATASIVFMPLGRFAPPITIYVAQDMEDRVLNYLSDFLPFEQHRTDAVDGLLRKIRF